MRCKPKLFNWFQVKLLKESFMPFFFFLPPLNVEVLIGVSATTLWPWGNLEDGGHIQQRLLKQIDDAGSWFNNDYRTAMSALSTSELLLPKMNNLKKKTKTKKPIKKQNKTKKPLKKIGFFRIKFLLWQTLYVYQHRLISTCKRTETSYLTSYLKINSKQIIHLNLRLKL